LPAAVSIDRVRADAARLRRALLICAVVWRLTAGISRRHRRTCALSTCPHHATVSGIRALAGSAVLPASHAVPGADPAPARAIRLGFHLAGRGDCPSPDPVAILLMAFAASGAKSRPSSASWCSAWCSGVATMPISAAAGTLRWALVPQLQPMRALLFVALLVQFLTAAAGVKARRPFEAVAWFALAT